MNQQLESDSGIKGIVANYRAINHGSACAGSRSPGARERLWAVLVKIGYPSWHANQNYPGAGERFSDLFWLTKG